jgi:pyridoxal phosphate enzyme (YggS family)
VDRERIALRLNDQRPYHAPRLNICIQVRLADEPGKGGVAPGDAAALARTVVQLPRLELRGLMCIPPPSDSHDEQLAFFKRLAELEQELIAQGFKLDTLSMGMSADLEAAIEAGATHVRVGTAIFGERPPR